MTDDEAPATRRIIGLVAVVLGAVLLIFSVVMLANGRQSGRTEHSGLAVAVAFLAIGVYEFARARRGSRPS